MCKKSKQDLLYLHKVQFLRRYWQSVAFIHLFAHSFIHKHWLRITRPWSRSVLQGVFSPAEHKARSWNTVGLKAMLGVCTEYVGFIFFFNFILGKISNKKKSSKINVISTYLLYVNSLPFLLDFSSLHVSKFIDCIWLSFYFL